MVYPGTRLNPLAAGSRSDVEVPGVERPLRHGGGSSAAPPGLTMRPMCSRSAVDNRLDNEVPKCCGESGRIATATSTYLRIISATAGPRPLFLRCSSTVPPLVAEFFNFPAIVIARGVQP